MLQDPSSFGCLGVVLSGLVSPGAAVAMAVVLKYANLSFVR